MLRRWPEVDFSWQAQHFELGRGLRRIDFVTGAVNRDLWACGSFSEESLVFHPELVFGSACVAKCTGRAARCESWCANVVAGTALANIHVHISRQVQCFVSIGTPISTRTFCFATHFGNFNFCLTLA